MKNYYESGSLVHSRWFIILAALIHKDPSLEAIVHITFLIIRFTVVSLDT